MSACIVHCNVYCCIVILHNSTSSPNRSVDMIVSISLSLTLSSKYLCEFLYVWHNILLNIFIALFPLPLRANFQQIDP